MVSTDRQTARRREIRDLAAWLVLAVAGLSAVLLGVRHAALGTEAAPFLGRYQLAPSPWLLATAAAVAAAVLVMARRVDRATSGGAGRPAPRFGTVQVVAYLAGLCWAVALAGEDGLTRRLDDTGVVVGDPLRYLRGFDGSGAAAAAGHPPGPALLLWTLHRLGSAGHLPTAVAVTALGTLSVPLLLAAVRNTCGDLAARRYAPVLVLAPSALFVAGSIDGVAATLGAGMIAAGARASDRRRTGRRSTGWALVAGLLLGLAVMFSYATAWLGLALVFLYFARRRPFLNIATGLSALVVPVASAALGFSWLTGLLAAHAGDTTRPASELLWGPVSLVTLLLVAGPPLVTSMRKLRNTPGWPLLAGAGLAIAFSVLAGVVRGGAETAWLPFFGWLTVAVTAPERQAGPTVPTPLVLSGAGAVVALLLSATLTPP